MRAYAQDQRIFDYSAAEADAIVGFKHGGGGDNAGNSCDYRFFIFASEEIVIDDPL